MQLPVKTPGNYSNGHQSTTLLIYTEVSKLVVEEEEVRRSGIKAGAADVSVNMSAGQQ